MVLNRRRENIQFEALNDSHFDLMLHWFNKPHVQAFAEEEYQKYRIQRDKEYLSDFDRELAKYLKGNEIQ